MLSARAAALRLLLALLAFGVVAASTVLGIEWRRGSTRALAEATRALGDRAADIADHLERDVRERERAVRGWAQLDVAQEIAIDDVDKRLAATLRDLARDLGAGDLALAVDPGGWVVASSDSSVLDETASERFVGLDTLRSVGTVRDHGGTAHFAVVAAVNGPDARPIGRLILLAPWSRLLSLGLAPATVARARLEGPGGVLFRGSGVPQDVDASAGLVGAGQVSGTAERALTPSLVLVVTTVEPREEVLAPVRAARRAAFLAAGAVLVVLIPAALLLTRGATRTLARHESLTTMGTMAAGLAHEIRTPLGVVRTSLELLGRGAVDAGRRTELTDIVREETGRLERLVDDLLAFARPRDPRRVAEDLAAIIRAAEPLMTALCARHGATLTTDLRDAPASVDAEQVRQVLLNLVDNAARAAGAGGRVTVSTTSTDRWAELTVQDTGPGVPPDIRARLWEPFVTSRGTGTGLGLAIVRRIAESHGGGAELAASGSRGAIFRVRFPSR